MFGYQILFLFIISSCSLFQTGPSLHEKEVKDLLTMVKTTGEGKGRTTSRGVQNLFSFESALLDNSNWVLAISIPLHGEELMVVPNLKEVQSQEQSTEGFDRRLMNILTQELGSKKAAQEYMHTLRSLLRFLNAKKLALNPECQHEKHKSVCRLDGQDIHLQLVKETLEIKTDEKIIMTARNLTDSFFSQTVFSLRSAQNEIFSLELFWKE